ncbi:SAM-dependent methyltransferase [Actinoplanes rectilineatus]|uniref:SAM-dependent methyltransferase n=1 Tax=Actinoplanes rectilineatus TaxID=113571 RepID=UPI0005F2C930|nr:SAM-dependent methyltransferase [Actinoplanes rectilineatus]
MTDNGVPHSARVWNHWLGGTDNYEVDRRVGDEFAALYPDITLVARHSRAFLGRAVTVLAAEEGIRQFLDVGTGIPSADHTHQVARAAAPDARVVYVDNDPLVVAHARGLLDGGDDGVAFLEATLHEPAAILAGAGQTLDLGLPVGLILMNILGHVPGREQAAGLVLELLAGLPSGSFLVTADGTDVIDGPAFTEAIGVWNANAPLGYHLRHPEELAGFLDGLDLLEPGLVPCSQWRPTPDAAGDDVRAVDEFGAVARKP